tara:strand:- start:319 stop:519 length:201 start_codon:yes stop_codon:yes gene_type:complete
MSEYKYTKEQVIENVKDGYEFILQAERFMWDSPWRENKEVEKYIDDALQWAEGSLEMLQYKLEEEE